MFVHDGARESKLLSVIHRTLRKLNDAPHALFNEHIQYSLKATQPDRTQIYIISLESNRVTKISFLVTIALELNRLQRG